jgi:hypothetical protein
VQRCIFLIIEQSSSPLAVEVFPERTAITEPILPREREFSLAHAQRCSFLIIDQSCGPLAVGIVPGSTAFSAPILPRERELSLEHAQRCNFLIIKQSCGLLAIGMFPRKHCDFITYLAKRARAHSGACAKVQFPEYLTVLWSLDSQNVSRKALRFQHLSCQESESSVWRMPRGAIS